MYLYPERESIPFKPINGIETDTIIGAFHGHELRNRKIMVLIPLITMNVKAFDKTPFILMREIQLYAIISRHYP